ncbi:hypothetical protein E2562_003827 [Oryza meyeriana var. granulata]|uniref:Jacalin-type lectin domain-containing protein n=1 Tax=Oryza meyeriana var. granulata TaxID=110450 RepID=A0A6G1BSA7_9ORYZ|nr:hypothetical protein E2562_003827 [Oryza meyeriana var. granulata]
MFGEGSEEEGWKFSNKYPEVLCPTVAAHIERLEQRHEPYRHAHEEVMKLRISPKMIIQPTKFGPWGGTDGEVRDVQVAPFRLLRLTIRNDDVAVQGISFSYIGVDGFTYHVGPWGDADDEEHVVRYNDR